MQERDEFETIDESASSPDSLGSKQESPSSNADSATNYSTLPSAVDPRNDAFPAIDQPLRSSSSEASSTTQRVGRYAIRKLLGRGGFGEVYLGFDEQLKREVAIKLTLGSRVGADAMRMCLAEAQMLAELDHPHIVPVFDIGTTERGDIYIISKLIDGTDLATRIKQDCPSRRQSLEVIAAIAEALDYAHTKGLIHRDIKPANILLDKADRPYLADFGIALHETDKVAAGEIIGTLAYMSPEQARGEGHLVSHQSDIYSLGVVLYELLSGRRPFRAKTNYELLKVVQASEVRSPRVFDTSITSDLERVCLKALARRPSDRYRLAKDLAEELRWLLANPSAVDSKQHPLPLVQPGDQMFGANGDQPGTDKSNPPRLSGSPVVAGEFGSELPSSAARVVPKGLRSFDAKDSDFFLELLPGPFDREGLPEGLRFWKDRIEATEIEESFRVGLVYGPSGCGKSSLMKAGLLPRLSPKIERVYVEATPNDTPARILKEIQKLIPEAASKSLVETLTLIRRKKLVPSQGKLLLVVDQFEQWLYSHDNYSAEELTNALRQCDGVTIQAIVMVRDDFWLSVSRFLQELDIPILERENSSLVDLFDLNHASKVLALFGMAYGNLPEDRTSWTAGQKSFLKIAVEGLAENRKVISVRLALFADMMKSRDWKPESIKDVGGIAGVGVTFLEETFGDRYAPMQIRRHQAAIHELLSALLPAVGTDIKGHSRSLIDLQRTVGYSDKPQEFADLVSLLDRNLRLITPVSESDADGNSRSYQLTHDYLVPALRQWLTQKQRGTRKGRAELKLAERAAAWSINQENKQLPTLWEWLSIQRLTDKRTWKTSESAVMRSATHFHVQRTAMILGMLMVCGAVGGWIWNRFAIQQRQDLAAATAESWIAADVGQLKQIATHIDRQSAWIADDFELVLHNPQSSDENKMRAILGLNRAGIPVSTEQWWTVANTMLERTPHDFLILCDLLRDAATNLREPFETILNDVEQTKDYRLRAAAALAVYEPQGASWNNPQIAQFVAEGIASANPIYLQALQQAFLPVAGRVLPFLENQYADQKTSEVKRNVIANLIAEYAKKDAATLASMIALSDPANYPTLLQPLRSLGDAGITSLERILDEELRPSWRDPGLDPAWKEVDEATRLRIEQAHGMLAERFAYVQDMPIDRFLEAAEILRASGYRPIRVRAWRWAQPVSESSNDSLAVPLVASLFTRDGRSWRMESNVGSHHLPKQDGAAANEDLVLEDLCSLPTVEGEESRFLALWSEPVAPGEERRVSLDISEKELQEVQSKLSPTHGAIRISVRTTPQGERRYTTIFSNIEKNPVSYCCYEGGQLLFRPQSDVGMSKPGARSFPGLATQRRIVEAYSGVAAIQEKIVAEPEIGNTTATAFYKLGDYAKALEICDACLLVQAGDPNLKLTRLLACARLKRADEAQLALEQYLPIAPDDSYGAYAKIQVVFLTEGPEAAASIIEQYRNQFKGNGRFLYHVFSATALCADAATNEEPRQRFVAMALKILEELIALGFSNGSKLENDIDLIVLHEQPRFLDLLDRLLPAQPLAGIWNLDTSIETQVLPQVSAEEDRGWIDAEQVSKYAAEGWRPIAMAVGDWDRTSSQIAEPYASIVLARPLISDEAKELFAKRRARTAVALYQLGGTERVWALFKTLQPDARLLSYFQNYLLEYGSDPRALVAEFLKLQPLTKLSDTRTELSGHASLPAIASLAITIGDFAQAKQLRQEQLAPVLDHALRLYSEDVDSGVHGACEWLLKQLDATDEIQQAMQEFALGERQGERHWYQTKTGGHVFAVFEPVEFVMGSPIQETERFGSIKENIESRHRRTIDHRFAIGMHEITIEQFAQFRRNQGFNRDYSREEDAPANAITWFDAVAFCNWLSEAEKIPQEQWCYVIDHQDPMNVRIPEDSLSRIGYRLPTEEEWEYACRAGSSTARSFGDTEDLLGRYAWYADKGSSHHALPVGSLRPNDHGLFDMLGNVFEWNHNSFYEYPFGDPRGTSEVAETYSVTKDRTRSLRGGSFDNRASNVRSAFRLYLRPNVGLNYFIGFRAARTYP